MRANWHSSRGRLSITGYCPRSWSRTGVKYLMDHAECYWLAQLYGLHLVDINFNDEPFTVLKLKRVGEGARIVIEDGNGKTLSYQGLDYTDFPMDEITLFASWSGEFWVAMLPSEY